MNRWQPHGGIPPFQAGLLPERIRHAFGLDFGAFERRVFDNSIATLRATWWLLPSATPYVYDQTNNLKTAAGRSYSYDATNKRVKTVANGITTYEFRSAQGLLLAEWKKQTGTFDTLKEHVHVAGKEVAEQQTLFSGTNIQPVGWMFLQHDASGSVLSGTWSSGGLLFKENYQPYGSQINGTAPGYTQRAFAGHKQDAQDLVYMGARYYNPQIGRFLSIDPKEADPSDLHSLNRYGYANNNPYRYVDPDGYTPLDIAFFAADAVRLGVAIYSGAGVADAAINLGFSAAGVLSPIPYAGQAAKALKVATSVVIAGKLADSALQAQKGVGTDPNVYAKPPSNAYDPKGPKAPGKPPAEVGFKDPKRGENWVPNPNPRRGGGSHGWEDEHGDVWVPTGQRPGRAHGGPHWDVQSPGGGYRNEKPPGGSEPKDDE